MSAGADLASSLTATARCRSRGYNRVCTTSYATSHDNPCYFLCTLVPMLTSRLVPCGPKEPTGINRPQEEIGVYISLDKGNRGV